MHFTPVLDELLICRIASTHHENTEFDHRFIPLSEWVTVVESKWRPGRFLGVTPLRANHRSRGRTLPDRWARAVTILRAVTAGSSMKVAPAFSRSGLMLHQPVARLPRVSPASESNHGPWQIAATILSAADAS